MKTAKKAILLVLCAIALVVASVLGTLAYLQFETAPVTNTFTAGKVEIALDEAKVDVYGVADNSVPRVSGNEYKLVPAHTYTKDPTIVVKAGSEASYLFVKVENGIADIEDGTTIASQLGTNGWTALDGVPNVYYKSTGAATVDTKVDVFKTFTIATGANVSAYTSAKVIVTAYAVQNEGFTTAKAAWDATFGAPANP